MRNYLPHFIQEQYRAGRFAGALDAATLFVDISGFTAMTDALEQHGEEGAEVLSEILNRVFAPPVNAIYVRGGFISTFAGDAFTAIFPDPAQDRPGAGAVWQAAACAEAIRAAFRRSGRRRTRFGEFTLAVKMGLACGAVEWGIAGREDKEYFFRGPAIDGCAAAEHQARAGEIVVEAAAAGQIGRPAALTPAGRPGFWLLDGVGAVPLPPRPRRPRLRRAVAARFLPPEVLDFDQKGEFRNVAVVFFSFVAAGPAALDALVAVLTTQALRHGGYLNKLDFGDKGGLALVLFGAPVAHENNVARAVDFCLAVEQDLAGAGLSWRAGLSYGTVYAGIIGGRPRCEYTAIGAQVNLAARLMERAGWGEVWTTAEVQRLARRYAFVALGDFSFKGKAGPEAVYLLQGRTAAEPAFAGRLIGRAAEIAQIEAVFARLAAGQNGGVVYLYGEAGIGKSRLVAEVRRRHPECAWAYLPGDDILRKSFHPLTHFFTRFFAQSTEHGPEQNRAAFEARYAELLPPAGDREDRVRAELTRLRTVLAGFLGIPYPGSLYEQLDPQLRYQNTLFAFQSFFQALALRRPVVLHVEDLHWLDPDSLQALRAIAEATAPLPLLVLATSRYAEDGSKPALPLPGPAVEIDLNRLSPEDVQELAAALLGGPPAAGLLAYLQNKAEGNPFFVEQTLRYLQETGAIAEITGPAPAARAWEMVRPAAALPATVNDLLIARVDRLAARLKEVVQTAAVIGQEFEVRLLAEVLRRWEGEASLSDLESMLGRGVEERIWASLSALVYVFSHALLRDAVYGMQLRQRLRDLHRVVAAALEQLFAGDERRCADLAYHYERAEVWDKAIEYLHRAGDFAQQTYAVAEAIAHYRKALALLPAGAAALPRRIALYEGLGEMLRWQLRYAEGIAAYEAMAAAAAEAGNMTAQLRAWLKMCDLYLNHGDSCSVLEVTARAGAAAQAAGLLPAQARALYYRGWALLRSGDTAAALAAGQQSLELSSAAGDRFEMAYSRGLLGVVYSALGRHRLAIEYDLQVLDYFREVGDRRRLGVALVNLGAEYNVIGDYRTALGHLQEALAILQESGARDREVAALRHLGRARLGLGEYEAAELHLRQALALADRGDLPAALATLAEALLGQGRLQEALDISCQALAAARECRPPDQLALAWWVLGQVAAALGRPLAVEGRPRDAASCFDEAQRVFAAIGSADRRARVLRDWARYELEQGEREKGTALWSEARAIFARLEMELEVERMDAESLA